MQQYADKFIGLGYDDLNQLQEMLMKELKAVLKGADIFKLGHQKRLLAAIQILQSKTIYGELCRSQNDELAIIEETAFRQDITAWPQIAKDLWVPNPMTAILNFYNAVLTSLLEKTYHLIPPIQFKAM